MCHQALFRVPREGLGTRLGLTYVYVYPQLTDHMYTVGVGLKLTAYASYCDEPLTLGKVLQILLKIRTCRLQTKTVQSQSKLLLQWQRCADETGNITTVTVPTSASESELIMTLILKTALFVNPMRCLNVICILARAASTRGCLLGSV